MTLLQEVKQKLKKYKKEDITLTNHAEAQASFRNIEIEEIKENICNPKKLKFVRKERAENPNEEKYDCYFPYSKYKCHRYIIVIQKLCLVVTVMIIKKDWQKSVEGK